MSKTPSLKQFYNQRLESLLQALSQVPEGKALADFAKAKKIRIELAPMSGGEWLPKKNKVRMGQNLQPDQALGALAHELRHAWQSHELPGLVNVEAKSGGEAALKITLLRGMEADAFSYQLAMMVVLQKQGIVKNIADAMMDKNNPIKAHIVREVQGFAAVFARRHGGDPFSSAARREAFDFFQSSQYFKSWYDDNYAQHFANARKSAKPAGLPSLTETFAVFSRNTVTPGGGQYLSPKESAAMQDYTLDKIDKSLKSRLIPAKAG